MARQPTCCAQAQAGKKVVVSDKTDLLLIRDAKSLPPEFAADIVLQVVEDGTSLTAAQKIKLLANAFDDAAQDQDDVQHRPWGSSVEENPEGLHAIASLVTRLDRISQQSRAVEDIARIDPKFARVKLRMIALPRFDPLPCEAYWTYLPDAYYEAVATVVATSFSAAEIAGGRRGELLASVVNRVVSHSQLPPVTRLISASDLSSAELTNIIPQYIYALDSLRGDEHSFNAVSEQSVREFTALVARLSSRGTGAVPLLSSFRSYLVANSKTLPCGPLKSQDNGRLPYAVQEFNDQFSDRLKAADLTVINLDEIKGGTKDSPPVDSEPSRWQSKEYSDLLFSVQKLPYISAANGAIGTDYQDYLLRLSDWSNQSEPETEFFQQKSNLFDGVIERLPPSVMRRNALAAFVKFLEQNSYEQVSRVDWFVYVRKLFQDNTTSAERYEVIDALADSSDPVLNLYGRVESWKRAADTVHSRHKRVQ